MGLSATTGPFAYAVRFTPSAKALSRLHRSPLPQGFEKVDANEDDGLRPHDPHDVSLDFLSKVAPTMTSMPSWNPPQDIADALEEGDGFWEDESWAPIRVTAMSGTEFEGRDIPVAWQLEFDPSDDEFEAGNARLEDLDLEPDGYGWGKAIAKAIRKIDPALAKRLHLSDCEADTCVIWVESEQDFRVLLETTWKVITRE